jgi:hypothetical protein
MKKFVLGLIALALPFALFAQTPPVMNVGLSWSAPTHYTNGVPIAPGELKNYTVLCGPTSQNLSLTANVAASQTTYSRGELIAQGVPYGTT